MKEAGEGGGSTGWGWGDKAGLGYERGGWAERGGLAGRDWGDSA
jgi:hypothetical protein